MKQEYQFRHELKYRISYAQYIELRNRLRTVMQSDIHTGVDGRYLIRSIYFDNYMDKALYEKRDGVPVREKFRIRYYNDDFSYLTLEKKIKDDDLCMKVDAQISDGLVKEGGNMTFNDIFKSSFLENVTQFSPIDTLIGMLFALVIGLFIFVVYKKTFNGVMYSSGFALTLVGLSLVTTLVIMAVTSNVVLSLGMVGALSIVRFRAAIKEPTEIVYLFWSIASGIVIGAGMIPLAVIGSAIIGVILILFANRKTHENPYILILNCKDEQAEDTAVKIARTALKRFLVKSKTVSGGGVELTAEVRLMDAATSFVNKLYDIEGVHNVTLVSYNGEYMS